MLVLATFSTMRPCSRNLTLILHLIQYLQTSMRWNVLLFLTEIWMCHASLASSILQCWSCSIVDRHNQRFQKYSVLFMYMLSCVHVQTKYIHVCTCTSILHCVLGRPTKKNQLVVSALTSIFSSPAESSLQRNLHPPCPYLLDLLPLQSGWITYTGLLILSCVGCQPNWQSG